MSRDNLETTGDESGARRCVSPFLAWGDFHARSRFARSTIPEEKWGLLVVYRSNRLFIHVTLKSLQKQSFESARDIQEHSKRLSKNYIYIRSNIYYIKIYIHIKK